MAIKGAQPVVEWRPRLRAWKLGATWIGPIICGTKRPKYRQLAEAAEDLSIKQELLDLGAVCEEAANDIEDRMPGG